MKIDLLENIVENAPRRVFGYSVGVWRWERECDSSVSPNRGHMWWLFFPRVVRRSGDRHLRQAQDEIEVQVKQVLTVLNSTDMH